MPTIGDQSVQQLHRMLRTQGIGLRLGDREFRIQSPLKPIARSIHVLHAHRPLRPPAAFSHFRVRFGNSVLYGRPAMRASVNGVAWHTWPRRLATAGMEWICSWCLFRGYNNRLAVHAAAAARPGSDQAILFPGDSGAGKSTLAATLMMSGWQLLSDELALIDVDDCTVVGLGRPVILKNESLDLVADRFGESAVFGPAGTSNDLPGRVAHLRPTLCSVNASGQRFRIAGIVLPQRDATSETHLHDMSAGESFQHLNQLGINYRELGEPGFEAAVNVARTVPAMRLVYQDAVQAEPVVRKWLESVQQQADNDVSLTSEETGADDGSRQTNNRATLTVPVGVASRNAGSDRHELLHQLLTALDEPAVVRDFSLQQWDRAIPLANHLKLLGHLARAVDQARMWSELPSPVADWLQLERQTTQFNHRCIRFEVQHLGELLRPVSPTLVLLKGAAYIEADFAWARGRRTTDVDVLVPEPALDEVEQTLRQAGYKTDEKLTAADSRYYRRWLHEIQPLEHDYRSIEVDVHFRLLPYWDRRSFDVQPMLQRSVAIDDSPFRMLDPIDRVLHGMLNLARIGEFSSAYRDLLDIRAMVQHEQFSWEELLQRAECLRLLEPVGLLVCLSQRLLGTEPPAEVESIVRRVQRKPRTRVVLQAMEAAARPVEDGRISVQRATAQWAMEHLPLPKLQAWLDPLTWSKRLQMGKEA